MRSSILSPRRLAIGLGGACALALGVAPRAPAQSRLSPLEMREGDPRERAEWWAKARAYPNREVPAAKVAAMRELRVSLRAGAFARTVAGEQWQPIGPTGFISMNTNYSSTPMTDEGRFASVAIHPRDPRIIIGGSGSAGIWRTVNGGASWQALTDNECSTSIGAVVFDPIDPRIVYAGTGEIFDPAGFTDGCGILRSTNGGDSWTRQAAQLLAPPGQLGAHVYQIAIDRSTAGSALSTTVFAASSAGVLRSTNAGASWTRVLNGDASSVVQHPTLPDIIYAALGNRNGAAENGVYRSTDRGVSWTRISGVLGSALTIGRTTMAVSLARPGALWVLMANPTNRAFRSLTRFDEDTGLWTTLPANGILFSSQLLDFGTQSEYNLVIGVDPDDENRVIIGGVRLFRSRDGGFTFQQIAANVHSDWHALAFDPQDPRHIVTGCDGGVFTSTNGGDSWRSLNNGISATQFYPGISVHPTNPAVVVGGTQDNGSMMSGGALFWSGISFGDGGWSMIDYTNPSIIITSSQNGVLQRHDLRTRSFQVIPNRTVYRPPFITPFIMDPIVPTTLYAGTAVLERSIDQGATWVPVSPLSTGEVTAIAVNRATPRTLWAGSNTGFNAVSRDGGVSWATGTIVARSTSDVTSDPNDPGRFGITFSGFGAAKVVLTPDAGVTLFNATGNLPDIPVNTIVFTPVRERFFVGTDIGVFETTNGGQAWSLTPGLPLVPVTDLVYHAATNRIIAGTYGRGMWTLPLSTPAPVLRGDVDRNGVINAADALLIQQGLAAIPLPAPLTVMPQGDANCNGALDAADAFIVLRFAVGLGNTGSCVNTSR